MRMWKKMKSEDLRLSRALSDYVDLDRPLMRYALKFLELSFHGVPWLIFAAIAVLRSSNTDQSFKSVNLLSALLVDLLVVLIIKFAVRRPRPPYHDKAGSMLITLKVDKQFSFPSGHTTRAVMCGLLLIHWWSLTAFYSVVVVIWSLSTALSRVLLGRHYLSDVVAGVMIGYMQYYESQVLQVACDLQTLYKSCGHTIRPTPISSVSLLNLAAQIVKSRSQSPSNHYVHPKDEAAVKVGNLKTKMVVHPKTSHRVIASKIAKRLDLRSSNDRVSLAGHEDDGFSMCSQEIQDINRSSLATRKQVDNSWVFREDKEGMKCSEDETGLQEKGAEKLKKQSRERRVTKYEGTFLSESLLDSLHESVVDDMLVDSSSGTCDEIGFDGIDDGIGIELTTTTTCSCKSARSSSHKHTMQAPLGNRYNQYGFSKSTTKQPVYNSQEAYHAQQISERPGRGVFTDTGQRVHRGQPLISSPQRPPRLPARNPQNMAPNKNLGSRSPERIKLPSKRDDKVLHDGDFKDIHLSRINANEVNKQPDYPRELHRSTVIGNLPDSDTFLNQAPKANLKHSQSVVQPSKTDQKPKISRSATIAGKSSYPNMIRQVSNKYQMLICPDFFPISKLNHPHRQNKRKPTIERDADKTGYRPNATMADDGFYRSHWGDMIPRELRTPFDQDFVEDPIEQTLYPSMIARDGQLSSLLHQHLYTSHREHPSITNQSFVDPTKPLISGNSEISPALSTSFDSGHTSTVSSSYQEILPVWYKMQSHQQREHEQRTENATIYPSSYQRNFKQVEDKTPAHHTDNFDEVLHSNSHVYENIRNQRINVQDSVRGYQFEPIAESTATHHKKKENYNKIFTTYSTYEGNQIEMSEALMVGNREDGKATLKLQQIAKPTMESKVRFLNQDEKHREYMKMQDHLATSQQYTPRIGAYQESHCVKVNTTTVSVSSLQQNSQVSPLPGAEVEPSRLQSSSHTSRNQMNDRNFIPIESSTHGTIALPKPMKSNKSLNSNLHLFTGDLVCKSNSKIQTHSRQHNAVPEKLKNYQRTLQSGVDIKTKEPFQSSASPSSPPTPEVDLLVLPKPKLLSDNMDNSHSLHVLPPAEDDPVVISSYLEVIRDSGADDSSHLSLNPAHILSQDEKQPPSTTNKLRLHDAKAHSSPRENGLITQADNSHLAQSERDLYVSVQSEAALAHDGNHDAVADVDNSSEDISGGEERDKLETEMNQLMDHLATVNGGLSEGLGEDILSITKMWKNLPSNDSWTAKRKALLDDPLMTAITHKMKALLEEATKEQISNKNMQKKSIIVTSEPVPSNFQEEFYNTTKLPNGGNLVIREPAEGSSDDPNESADLRSKRNRNSENSQPTKLGSYSKLNNLPMNVAHNGHSHSKLNQSNNLDSKLVSLNIRNKLSSDRWNEEPQYPIPSQVQGENDTEEDMIESEYVTQTKHVKLVDPGEENIFKMIRKKSSDKKRVSKSRSPRNLTILTQLSESDDSDMVEDDDIIADGNNQEGSDGSENVNEADHQYLSDFLRHKSKRKRHKPSLKKISFSKDSSKAKAGDIIGPASQSSLHSRVSDESNSLPSNKSEKALLSVNPFMNNKNNNSIENLDLPAPLITSPTSSVSDAENNLKLKSRPGILKRSEETEGSQLSLGTCSAFGSHVSLDSEVSRAGSFPLLTLSDGSKKDFKIVFDDVDVNDMGNLFKVSRKARSEGAASEPESTDESDDGATLISCKACHTRKPLFKARLVFKMCHGCYTYYCSSECRRRDWPAHKPLCIVSRLSSLARKIFKRVASDDELLHHCSRFARTGYLCEGRGAVVLSFSSPRKAQLFLSNAKQAKESALYLSIKDLQQFTFDDKRDKEQLLANCRHYNPDEKFILHLAIKMNKKYSSQPVEPRIKGREFHKWARIRLIEYLPSPKRECVDDEETLILTAMTEPYDQLAQEAPDQKTREIFFANVLTKLRKRGISLRHQYPDVYSALCQYVTSGKVFAPISLFAFNLHTQKRFMCCILPYSDPDVSWENNPHLLEDLNLAVAL